MTIALDFSGLPAPLRNALETELNESKTHPFQGRTHIEVIRHTDGLIFRIDEGKGGYLFCRNRWGAENDVEVFRHFLQDSLQSLYMPIVYESKEQNARIVGEILEKYATYGAEHAAKIDWTWWEKGGRHLLLMRIPKEIVRALVYREGGVLSTQVRGPVAAIRDLPVLSKIVPEDAVDGETMHRAFVTPYTSETYQEAVAIHQAAMREVVNAPARGISIGPVGVWTP